MKSSVVPRSYRYAPVAWTRGVLSPASFTKTNDRRRFVAPQMIHTLSSTVNWLCRRLDAKLLWQTDPTYRYMVRWIAQRSQAPRLGLWLHCVVDHTRVLLKLQKSTSAVGTSRHLQKWVCSQLFGGVEILDLGVPSFLPANPRCNKITGVKFWNWGYQVSCRRILDARKFTRVKILNLGVSRFLPTYPKCKKTRNLENALWATNSVCQCIGYEPVRIVTEISPWKWPLMRPKWPVRMTQMTVVYDLNDHWDDPKTQSSPAWVRTQSDVSTMTSGDSRLLICQV